MRKQPPHQTNTVLSWVGWLWLKRIKGKDCRLALSVNYSLSRRTRMFSRPPGPMSESCVTRLIMDLKSTGNPTQAGAATILFSIFVTRRDFPTRSDLCCLRARSASKTLCAKFTRRGERRAKTFGVRSLDATTHSEHRLAPIELSCWCAGCRAY